MKCVLGKLDWLLTVTLKLHFQFTSQLSKYDKIHLNYDICSPTKFIAFILKQKLKSTQTRQICLGKLLFTQSKHFEKLFQMFAEAKALKHSSERSEHSVTLVNEEIRLVEATSYEKVKRKCLCLHFVLKLFLSVVVSCSRRVFSYKLQCSSFRLLWSRVLN